MWFDSHCHLDFTAFDADRVSVVARARAAGVDGLFVPGVRVSQWPALAELELPEMVLAIGVGLHPYFLHELTERALDAALAALPESYERLGACAVGECGLDGRVAKRGGASMELQQRLFESQIRIALELDAPLVVHVVQAHGLALSVLERYGQVRGVLHSYSGAPELVTRYARCGLYFGFGGAITRDKAVKARRALQAVPGERLLLETDAPDQPPAPIVHLGLLPNRNEPCVLPQIGALAASLRDCSVAELAQQTSDNARRLYGLPRRV